jgi:TolB-like protein/Flp pilus assembly protein TadD
MKRCPQCNRLESDNALGFCRVDGMALINDSASLDCEIETSILPHATDATLNRATAPTTVLPLQQSANTGAIIRRKQRKTAILLITIVAAVAASVSGALVKSCLSKKDRVGIESIAVLPFENRSGNTDTDYLSDGLADSLIYRLSQLPNLTVSPTSSVMRYKGKETDVAQIAKELEVDAVMSGRLVQRGEDLSISVQLIDSRTKKLIWAEQYDRKMSDLLATQREIATTITQKLQLQLSGDEKGITKKYTNSNEAYQLYLKGRHHYAKRTREDFQKGIEYFEHAVKVDPNFALAYAWIADSYASMPAYPYLSPKDAFPKSKAAAKRALEIDPNLAEAHTALAYSLGLYDWNWAGAEREFQRAIELDPKNALAHVRFAISYYLPTGRMDKAVKEVEIAVELEPLNLVGGANLTWMLLEARRNTDALAQAKKSSDLEPDFVLGRYQLGLAYIANGMYQEAISLSEKPLQADPSNQLMLQIAGKAYAKSGRRKEANAIISRFKEISKTQYVMSFFVATIYAELGEKDAAFAEMENAYQERDWRMSALLKTEPMIDSLRDDPRYKAMLKRLNLAE